MGERFPNADGRIDNGERIVPSIVGIGATGISTVNALISSGMPYADFLAIDTVPQPLEKVLTPAKSIYITPEDSANAIREAVQASFASVFKQGFSEGWLVIIASLDDATGTAFAPVVAKVAKELGAFVFSIVTIPLPGELMPGVSAENCLNALRCHVDLLLPFSIDHLRTAADPALQFHAQVETLLSYAVKGFVEFLAYTNYICIDFADLKTAFYKTSVVGMGVGTACGESRALAATKKALADPMLAGLLPYADSIFVNITGWNIYGNEINEISVILETVAAACCDETNIAFVDCNLEAMGEKLRVTIFAGSDAEPANRGKFWELYT